MTEEQGTSNVAEVDVAISKILRWGVVLSSLITLAGAILFIAEHGHEAPDFSVFVGTPENLRSIPLIFSDAFHMPLNGQSIIQLGVIALLATPLARVAFSVYAFARQKDWKYVVITLIVLAILLYSLMYRHH